MRGVVLVRGAGEEWGGEGSALARPLGVTRITMLETAGPRDL